MDRETLGRRAAKCLGLMLLGLIISATFKPSSALAWWNSDWSARKAITVDTSSAGAAITDPIGTTPVLIRLDVSNFTFDAANPDGSDLRFVAADDKTPLAYHIEKYDHLLGQAFIWVSLPTLAPGAQTNIFLYYGNPKATAGDDAKGSYDSNMVAVYHFGEHGAPARDWTGHGNTAQNAGQADDYALIAGGLRLDGQSTVALPASPALAWAGGDAATISIWADETALQPDAILYSRTDGTNTVQIGVDNGVPFVAVITPNGTQRSSAGAPIQAGSWHNLVLAATASAITLYVDKQSYATLAVPLPALNTIAYLGGDASTGTAAAAAPAPATPAATPAPATAAPPAAPVAATATTGFIGTIDELEISNIARPTGFIAFGAINQGSDPLGAKLLTFSPEQKPASWVSGYLVVILSSVTIDGWVIIGILMIMAMISWVVMAEKVSYVNRTVKANKIFLAEFSHVAYDLTALDKQAIPKPGDAAANGSKAMQNSPLYHLYHVGAEEIGMRFRDRPAGQRRILSAQSIAAIRSALDSRSVREIQQLNKSMVLLTIAIAGGPFLGLLGTVVGVMITFASIAAAGDVNVNAIAPGISAALVATVAGLIVAIPALFGYNYLGTRIRDLISDMQVFVDEFETKMAEYYSPAVVESSLAAE